MSVELKIDGLSKVTKELNSRLSRVKNMTASGMNDVVLDCLGKSVNRAPVDLGDLRGSGYASINNVTVAKGSSDGSVSSSPGGAVSGNKIEGIVGFNEPYALVQHERLDYDHPKGGEAKYLEKTLSENTEKYINHLSEGVKKAIT
ncbi:MAG: hypothetical protein Q8920_04470 [Bacillota bacterium]|nr:hypothetical protein [Bacillota bacterium]